MINDYIMYNKNIINIYLLFIIIYIIYIPDDNVVILVEI